MQIAVFFVTLLTAIDGWTCADGIFFTLQFNKQISHPELVKLIRKVNIIFYLLFTYQIIHILNNYSIILIILIIDSI